MEIHGEAHPVQGVAGPNSEKTFVLPSDLEFQRNFKNIKMEFRRNLVFLFGEKNVKIAKKTVKCKSHLKSIMLLRMSEETLTSTKWKLL